MLYMSIQYVLRSPDQRSTLASCSVNLSHGRTHHGTQPPPYSSAHWNCKSGHGAQHGSTLACSPGVQGFDPQPTCKNCKKKCFPASWVKYPKQANQEADDQERLSIRKPTGVRVAKNRVHKTPRVNLSTTGSTKEKLLPRNLLRGSHGHTRNTFTVIYERSKGGFCGRFGFQDVGPRFTLCKTGTAHPVSPKWEPKPSKPNGALSRRLQFRGGLCFNRLRKAFAP